MSADTPSFLASLAVPALVYAVPLAVGIGFSWVAPPLRGGRNLGIFGCYLLLILGPFVFGWARSGATWLLYGAAGGVLYFGYEVLAWARAEGEERTTPRLGTLVNGLMAWPIMVPDAVEHALAQTGVLAGRRRPSGDGEG